MDKYKEALERIANIQNVSFTEAPPEVVATKLFFLLSKIKKIALNALEEEEIVKQEIKTIEN